jgi:N-acetylneuraminate synthase
MGAMIIAEAGVNHNGSLEAALELVDAAAAARADVVKFQTYMPEEVISSRAPKAEYALRTTDAAESQLDMARRIWLPYEAFHTIAARCRERGIAFLSTPFDLPSLDFLAEGMKLETIKLPSGEITNAPLLLRAARTGRRLIVSTGMASLAEVEAALGVLAFGYTTPNESPYAAAFPAAFASEKGRAALAAHVTLLHCTTEYPSPAGDANLRAMATLRAAFGLPVGLSDHTKGIAVPVAAVALGASAIEKHFTLSRDLPGPDHKASLEPAELAEMVAAIRDVEAALGDGVKVPRPSEIGNIPIARKSLVARRAIAKGERFDELNLAVKRPGDGVSPMHYWDWLGRVAARDYAADEKIDG